MKRKLTKTIFNVVREILLEAVSPDTVVTKSQTSNQNNSVSTSIETIVDKEMAILDQARNSVVKRLKAEADQSEIVAQKLKAWLGTHQERPLPWIKGGTGTVDPQKAIRLHRNQARIKREAATKLMRLDLRSNARSLIENI